MSDPADEVMDLIFGRWRSQTLYHGVELGVFEVLADGPRTAARVAEELDLDPDNTYRLMRGLGSLGLPDEGPDRSFPLTDRGVLLTKGDDSSLRGLARLIESPEQYAVWPRLSELARTGEEEAFEDEFGQSMFEYTHTHPEHAEVFHEGMESNSAIETQDVLSALEGYDFSTFSRICDVGGGTGHLLGHLLDEHPHLEGTVLELPEVAEQAGAVPEQLGVGDRITFTAGDMFDEVPAADAYLMKQITPDWSDEECVEILETIRAAADRRGVPGSVPTVGPGVRRSSRGRGHCDERGRGAGGLNPESPEFGIRSAGRRRLQARPRDPLASVGEYGCRLLDPR